MTFYLTQHIQNIIISTCDQSKAVLMSYFTFFRWSLASTPPISFLHMSTHFVSVAILESSSPSTWFYTHLTNEETKVRRSAHQSEVTKGST